MLFSFPKNCDRAFSCVTSALTFVFAVLFLAVLPFSAEAGIIITEIMYDLDGSDAGREWVEVHNTGSEPVDLSAWRFFENDTNHALVSVLGDGALDPGAYAVIADNAEKFRVDWPSFSGILFDSAFSLNNTGETIALRNADLVDVDAVAYSSEWGAAGDGNSLSRLGGEWRAAAPTPGKENAVSSGTSDSTADETDTPAASSASGGGGGGGSGGSGGVSSRDFPVEPHIFADAGDDRTVAVGADTVFSGRATGLVGEPITDARIIWNFGDGETKEGRSVFHFYRYPGTYVATLSVASGEYAASDSVTVTARPADVAVTEATDERIIITNSDTEKIDLSWWLLETKDKSGQMTFTIPKHTVIPRGGTLILASETTGLVDATIENTTLLYPNGVLAYAYEPEPAPPRIFEESVAPTPADPAAAVRPPRDATPFLPKQNEESVPTLGALPPSVFPTSTTRAALHAAASDYRPLTPWLLALFGILALAALAVVGAKRTKTEADDYTITE